MDAKIADWTFVCPEDYRKIENKDRRIQAFFNDGVEAGTEALKKIGYAVNIDIPKRYKRHFNMLKNRDFGL